MKRKGQKIKIMIILSAFFQFSTIFSSIAFAQSLYTQKAADFFNYINQYRKAADVPTLEKNGNLYKAANNHVTYMNYYRVSQQQQQKNNRYFTGVYSWDRAAYFRYQYPLVMEFVGKGVSENPDRLDTFIHNPYHRIFWLSPEYIHMAFEYKNQYSTFLLGGQKVKEDKIVIYPNEKQTNIPTLWSEGNGAELLSDTTLKEKNKGYPITLSYYSKNTIKNVEAVDVEVKDQLTGRNIDIVIESQKDNSYLVNGLLIIPLAELQNDRTYQVKVIGKVTFDKQGSKEIKKTWSFTTRPLNESKMQDTLGEWSEDIIHSLYKKGIVEPKRDKSFLPNQVISRQEFAKMMVKAFHLPELKSKKIIFKDVSISNPYAKYIDSVSEFMQGYEYQFYPTLSLTREEGIVIVMRMYKQLQETTTLKSQEDKNVNHFSDLKKASTWAQPSIIEAQKIGLVQGREKNQIIPKENMTRAEAATFIYRLLEMMEKSQTGQEEK
ncbi:MAG: hypothetical protein GX962_00130 [Epulopiscium sp.]|mgnify:CR=1 FL=1|nr:hypothetical protein [Candidatus Epulonipiscium sp.]